MSAVPEASYLEAIRAGHGAEGRLTGRVRVHETLHGETLWEGEVLLFQLRGHAEAVQCFAWESDGEVVTVLATGSVRTPAAAVRAALLASLEPADGVARWPVPATG